jgi:predicted small metal-binding protein
LPKKKLLFNSDFSRTKTGFGRNAKAVLRYLYNTGKYEIVEFACAPYHFEDKRLKSVPWKAYGAIPEDPFIRKELEANPMFEATSRYGSFYLDEVIRREKPDFFLGVNDIWAFVDVYDKPWWNKINCALWITLDSLPIFEMAIEHGHKVKDFWVWSKFAENEMKRIGFDHVETLHGAFDVSDFYPLDNKMELKKKFKINDNLIFGFVFRNQGRKLIGTLLEGFKIFKENSPNDTSKLLLHTCWSEGWDIPKFIKEFDLNNDDILTSHICTNCKKYDVRPFEGEQTACRFCHAPHSCITPHGAFGLSEKEMNEVYNLMDFYIHPITSGGLEMPLVESLLAGTPIATVNYSCGEEFCEQPFVTRLPFSTYREMGSQFIKSQPYAQGVADVMRGFKDWISPKTLSEVSQEGRDWALKEFDLNLICKRIERWLDTSPPATHEQNENYPFNDTVEDPEEWAIDLIKNIFGYKESSKNETVQKIVTHIQRGHPRIEIHNDALSKAKIHNDSKKANAASNFFKVEEETDNVCLICPAELEEKLIVSKFFSKLSREEANVFLAGTESDGNIFSQYGKFTLIPKNNNTANIDWLKNVKTESGKPRFKKIYFKNGNQIEEIENK